MRSTCSHSQMLQLVPIPGFVYARGWLSGLAKMKRRWRPGCESSLLPLEFLNLHLMGVQLIPEPDMTRFDTIVGDGNCGETFAGSAEGSFRSTLFACP
ncbi:hypothetical protein BDR07DRAFT_1397473 [Suillus spraguei]|nr:hypothetical protein BDR07DRAFT_1397473 [Suillus spraguei]